MLKTLRSIVQDVNHAHDLEQALTVIVRRVKAAVKADACSVYFLDQATDDLVLMASDGYLSESIGAIRIPIDQGLVGLVTAREEPINLDNAPDHPSYRFSQETGEGQYHAFLGVPIIHQRQVLGVLVLRQRSSVRYSEDIVTFLVTIAAQLSGAIMHAQISGGIAQLLQDKIGSYVLHGLPGAPGIAIGSIVVVDHYVDIDSIPDRIVDDTEAEQRRLMQAVTAVKNDIRNMIGNMASAFPGADTSLFDAYLLMLEGGGLIDSMLDLISTGSWAPAALRDVISSHARAFSDMDDQYLRERADDIHDLGRRILTYLQEQPAAETIYPMNTVLVGEDIPATLLAEVPQNHLAGVVSKLGSTTSHTAILAHALGVPAVLGVHDLPMADINGLDIIVDGYAGQVFINATTEVQHEYKRLQNEERELNEDLQELAGLDAVTKDGQHVPLYANTGLLSDIRPSLNSSAEGVGLYRTEFPFMVLDRFPGEEEQCDTYRQVLKAFSPRPVTMRTLDVGGDKSLPYFPITEDNPFLGWRGIRITLDHPEIFLVQVRAMLQANIGLNNLKILLPMISTLAEVDEALLLIRRACAELQSDGLKVTLPPVGVMIEVPSMVYQVDALARRVDFLSIGSNDLTQYLLAVDRNNPRVADLYDSLDPSVLFALRDITRAARKHRIPVSVCGEMAGDPLAAILLVGLGINELSMSVSSLLRIKWVIRSFSHEYAKTILEEVLSMESPKIIRRYLSEILIKTGLGGLVHAGK